MKSKGDNLYGCIRSGFLYKRMNIALLNSRSFREHGCPRLYFVQFHRELPYMARKFIASAGLRT